MAATVAILSIELDALALHPGRASRQFNYAAMLRDLKKETAEAEGAHVYLLSSELLAISTCPAAGVWHACVHFTTTCALRSTGPVSGGEERGVESLCFTPPCITKRKVLACE